MFRAKLHIFIQICHTQSILNRLSPKLQILFKPVIYISVNS